jgi:hypothetical protein
VYVANGRNEICGREVGFTISDAHSRTDPPGQNRTSTRQREALDVDDGDLSRDQTRAPDGSSSDEKPAEEPDEIEFDTVEVESEEFTGYQNY